MAGAPHGPVCSAIESIGLNVCFAQTRVSESGRSATAAIGHLRSLAKRAQSRHSTTPSTRRRAPFTA